MVSVQNGLVWLNCRQKGRFVGCSSSKACAPDACASGGSLFEKSDPLEAHALSSVILTNLMWSSNLGLEGQIA